MRCPICQKALIKTHVPHRGFYHRCNEHGVYASEFFLKLTPHGPQILKDLKQPGLAHQPPIPCIYCQKPMPKKVLLQQVPVENCHGCKMVWFDYGEIEVIQSETLPQTPRAERKPGNFEWASNSVEVRQQIHTMVPGFENRSGIARSSLEAKAGLGVVTVSLIVLSVCGQFIIRTALSRGTLGSSSMLFRPDLSLWANKIAVLASGFGHASFGHFFSNMYFLWIFMNDIEEEDGARTGFLLFLGGVIGGNLLYYFSGRMNPSLGASAGVFAAMLYFVLRFPDRQFHLVWGHHRWRSWANDQDVAPATLTIPAWIYFGLFIVKEGVLAKLQYTMNVGMTNHIAHIGGAGVGLLIYLWQSSKRAPAQ